MRLLPQSALVKTGPVDLFSEWGRRPLVGPIIRHRFRLALSLLPDSTERILEVGFGSGVFMPVLAERAGELYGIDVHPHTTVVATALERAGVTARLYQGSAEKMPFQPGWFDAAVALSSLEFMQDLAAAVDELVRVLSPRGVLVVVTPAHSPLADAGLRMLTGKKAEDDFQGRRQTVIPTLLRGFHVERRIMWPTSLFPLYSALRLRPRGTLSGKDG
jgi:SAM-dependent methyltransferase